MRDKEWKDPLRSYEAGLVNKDQPYFPVGTMNATHPGRDRIPQSVAAAAAKAQRTHKRFTERPAAQAKYAPSISKVISDARTVHDRLDPSRPEVYTPTHGTPFDVLGGVYDHSFTGGKAVNEAPRRGLSPTKLDALPGNTYYSTRRTLSDTAEFGQTDWNSPQPSPVPKKTGKLNFASVAQQATKKHKGATGNQSPYLLEKDDPLRDIRERPYQYPNPDDPGNEDAERLHVHEQIMVELKYFGIQVKPVPPEEALLLLLSSSLLLF